MLLKGVVFVIVICVLWLLCDHYYLQDMGG